MDFRFAREEGFLGFSSGFGRCLTAIVTAFLTVFVAIVLVAVCFPNTAHAESSKGRHVYVVFDDSTSMVEENGAWCEAQYALECFVAMLGEKDVLTIYPMSAFSGANPSRQTTTYYGSDDASENVKRVHVGDFLKEKDGYTWNADTVFKAAEAAYDEMKSNLGESRLIVLTDGAFFQVGNKTAYTDEASSVYGSYATEESIANDIESQLKSWANSGANIYYLALGKNAPTELLPGETTGLTVKQCANNSEIIKAVIASCNWAFKRASLSEYMQNGATTLPLKKIIVFAQGSEASKIVVPDVSSIVDVKYPSLLSNSATFSSTPSPNTQLNGTVSTINKEYSIGDTTFSDLVSAESAEVYFEPNAVIKVDLVDGDDWEYDTTGDKIDIKAGSGYKATFTLCDPDTLNELSLGDWAADCSATLEIDGQDPIEIKQGETFDVPQGVGHLSTNATLVDKSSGAEVSFAGETHTVTSSEKTILDWILHYWFVLPILLLIALAIVAALIVRKHLNAPRLPQDLYPELYDSYNGTKPATLSVEALAKNTPFFGAETQCFDLIVKSPYRSRVMPQSVVVRAVDKKGNMVIDNWDELLELSKYGEKDCVKLGSKKVADCKPEDPPLPLTTGSRIKFLGTRSGDEALIELRFKSNGRRRNQ